MSTKLLDNVSLPLPADERRLAIGFEAWRAVLATDGPEAGTAREWSTTPAGKRLLAAIFGNSPFLSEAAVKEWAFLTRLVEKGADPVFAETVAGVEARDDTGEDIVALMARLRVAKRRVALLAAVAELAGAWSIEQQMAALSRFADAALGAALRYLLRQAARDGTLALADGDDPEAGSGFVILGLGKLGGGELNYSSDIDLIVLYDPAVARAAAPDRIQPLFIRLTRNLVRIIEERTGDGYVFRTDLRLRPDPASTPPAISVAAALSYYESVGQNWERAALIKARPAAGDRLVAEHFLRDLQPFIWRKNLDFAAIQDIHSIKRQIDAHRGGARIRVARPRHQDRPRRHPRDRIFCPDPAADLGRPGARIARRGDLRRTRPARPSRPRRSRDRRRASRRLSFFAPGRASPSDGR